MSMVTGLETNLVAICMLYLQGCSAALAGIVLLLGPFLLVPLLAAELVFAVWFFRAKNKLSAQPRVRAAERQPAWRAGGCLL